MGYTAAYLAGQVVGREFGGGDFVPESSRRARGFATWAALRSLGRSGIVDLVDRCCGIARRFAEGLDVLEGVEVGNEVVLNQVLVRVGDGELTNASSVRFRKTARAGWVGRPGVTNVSFASPSRTGRRQQTTSTAWLLRSAVSGRG